MRDGPGRESLQRTLDYLTANAEGATMTTAGLERTIKCINKRKKATPPTLHFDDRRSKYRKLQPKEVKRIVTPTASEFATALRMLGECRGVELSDEYGTGEVGSLVEGAKLSLQ